MSEIKLNGDVIKFESLDEIELAMEHLQKKFFKKYDYILLLKDRVEELRIEREQILKYYEDLDYMRGNFKENYQLIS